MAPETGGFPIAKSKGWKSHHAKGNNDELDATFSELKTLLSQRFAV